MIDDIDISKNHRVKNMRHKKYQRLQYLKQCKWNDHCQLQQQALNKFNFKKTTALKKKYSCGGYGGRCNMCKSNFIYGQGKKNIKSTVFYGNKQFNLLLSYKQSF